MRKPRKPNIRLWSTVIYAVSLFAFLTYLGVHCGLSPMQRLGVSVYTCALMILGTLTGMYAGNS